MTPPSGRPAADELRAELGRLADAGRAQALARFFKTGRGQYGEGDVFIGVPVPALRRVAKKYSARASLGDAKTLLQSEVHEERLVALLLLVQKYRDDPDAVTALYLGSLEHVNSWDLVDLSAPRILGAYLGDSRGDMSLLYRLARSRRLWDRRVAIIVTLAFIRAGDFGDTLRIAEILLKDPHHLIHKAVGWMLREVGNRDMAAEEAFLRRHAAEMPRTMLRYAIEKFPAEKRRTYMLAKK
jgi:3-methyladenine DNA glycosylase AlkD